MSRPNLSEFATDVRGTPAEVGGAEVERLHSKMAPFVKAMSCPMGFRM